MGVGGGGPREQGRRGQLRSQQGAVTGTCDQEVGLDPTEQGKERLLAHARKQGRERRHRGHIAAFPPLLTEARPRPQPRCPGRSSSRSLGGDSRSWRRKCSKGGPWPIPPCPGPWGPWHGLALHGPHGSGQSKEGMQKSGASLWRVRVPQDEPGESDRCSPCVF